MWKFVQPSLALVALLAAASPASADTTFSNASAVIKPKPFDLHDYFTLDMTSFYNGASVTGIGSPYQPTPDGYDDTGNKTMFQTRFRPAYKITPDLTIGPVLEWNYWPNFGGDYSFGDIFVRIAYSKVIDTPQLKAAGDLRFYFPNSGGSIANDQIISARAYLDATYTFKGTNFSIGMENLVRGWAYGSNVPDKYADNKPDASDVYTGMWWWGPYINYDFSPKFGVKFQIDNDFYSAVGTSEVKSEIGHLRMGVGWSPIPELFLAPHLYVPINNFSWSAAALNLEAWSKLF